MVNRVRMDKWLWAARFFKTRALAGDSCDMGRIECNGQTAKPSREVRVEDKLVVRHDGFAFEIEVLIVSENRGPGAVAQTMYVESEESKERVQVASERKAMHEMDAHRPTKRDRRDINRMRGR